METGEGGDGLNRARRLVESLLIRCWLTAIGALGIATAESDAFSVRKLELIRDTNREWTRFKRASFLDLRLSFSIAEQKEVNDTPAFKNY